jgi:hypothetical protein
MSSHVPIPDRRSFGHAAACARAPHGVGAASPAVPASRHPWALGLLAVLALVLALPAGVAWAEAGDYRVVDGGKVYLGNGRLFARPCVVQADRVYREIAEYREILDKGLTDKDARYHFLMKRASERFLDAVKRMATELDFDLVAEVGVVKPAKRGVEGAPERTDDVISRLR